MPRYSALAHATYMEQLESTSEEISAGPLINLWLVVELPSNDFSKKIEYNEELDLLLASEGKFVGFARTREELIQMTTSSLDPESADEVSASHVYLTYRAEFRGTKDLQKLLEFLLAEGMLKPQNT